MSDGYTMECATHHSSEALDPKDNEVSHPLPLPENVQCEGSKGESASEEVGSIQNGKSSASMEVAVWYSNDSAMLGGSPDAKGGLWDVSPEPSVVLHPNGAWDEDLSDDEERLDLLPSSIHLGVHLTESIAALKSIPMSEVQVASPVPSARPSTSPAVWGKGRFPHVAPSEADPPLPASVKVLVKKFSQVPEAPAPAPGEQNAIGRVMKTEGYRAHQPPSHKGQIVNMADNIEFWESISHDIDNCPVVSLVKK